MIDWFNQLLLGEGEQILREELAWLPLATILASLLAGWLWLRFRVKRGKLLATNSQALRRMFVPSSRWLQRGMGILCVFGLLMLSIAVINPAVTGLVPRENAVVMAVLDLSGSMNEPDAAAPGQPQQTRLEAAVDATEKFVTELPEEFMVGLTVYSDLKDVEVLVSPRQDREPILSVLDELEANGGTAIGEGIVAAATAIENFNAGAGYRPDLQPPSVAVLLSDGAWDQGIRPEQAVTSAQSIGLSVNTVSFGRDGTQLDPATMQMIAETTGGLYFSAENASQLDAVYDQLKDLIGYEEVLTSVAAKYAFYGLSLLAAALLLAMMSTRGPVSSHKTQTQEEEETWTMYAA